MNTKPRKPLRLGLAGLSHDHLEIIGALTADDFEIAGLCDPDPVLLADVGRRLGLAADRLHGDLAAMLAAAKPDAVAAFGPIFDHLAVVEACAPAGVHVMVEKPLAVSIDHAQRMVDLAAKHGIHLLTNYETTWYPSVDELFHRVRDGSIGTPWKALIRDGHPGPIESGCGAPFLAWLTDPARSGGGALTDFGCYGANLMTALMDGRLPETVTASARTVKPGLYGAVEDDALIILRYAGLEAVIEASWNWPFPRKDMEVQGSTGAIAAVDAQTVRLRRAGDAEPASVVPPPLPRQRGEPFAYLAAVVRGEEALAPASFSGPGNNLAVVRILAAAQQSARTGRTVVL